MAIKTKAFWNICKKCGEYWGTQTRKCKDCGGTDFEIKCGHCGKEKGICKCK